MKGLCKAVKAAGKLIKKIENIDFTEITSDESERAALDLEMLKLSESVINIQNRLLEIIGGE